METEPDFSVSGVFKAFAYGIYLGKYKIYNKNTIYLGKYRMQRL